MAGQCWKTIDMRPLRIIITGFIITMMSLAAHAQQDCSFKAETGLLILEAEDMALPDGWQFEKNNSGYTGEGYIVWRGADHFGEPGHGLIKTNIFIAVPGLYHFKWRSKIGEGDNSTEFNDTWLRFQNVADFYAIRNGGEKVYAHGSGKTPNPEGNGADGWMKVYLSGSTDWTWSTNTFDNHPHQILVEFDKPGLYVMELSGRSAGHMIDRIILAKDGNSKAESLDSKTVSCSK